MAAQTWKDEQTVFASQMTQLDNRLVVVENARIDWGSTTLDQTISTISVTQAINSTVGSAVLTNPSGNAGAYVIPFIVNSQRDHTKGTSATIQSVSATQIFVTCWDGTGYVANGVTVTVRCMVLG